MHRKLKGETRKRRFSFGEYVLLLLIGAFAFMTAGELHNRGIPHKWATAIMGTLVTFGIVFSDCREEDSRQVDWHTRNNQIEPIGRSRVGDARWFLGGFHFSG